MNKLIKNIIKLTSEMGWGLCSLAELEKIFEGVDLSFEREDDKIISCLNNEQWYISRIIHKYAWYFIEDEKIQSFFKRLMTKKGLSSELRYCLYYTGVCQDDDIILNNMDDFSQNQALYVLQRVKFSKLENFTNSKSKSIRYAAYSRLGRDADLSKMSKDKIADVRLLAVDFLNYGDPILTEMAKVEKSGKVLASIAKKVKKSDLIFLIGKKSRATWSQKYFEDILKSRTS